jgi:hypothetical protein
MVDALSDVWRVLVNGGTLVDLRPFAGEYPLHLLTRDAAIPIGENDTTRRADDDAAADAAVMCVVDKGLFAARSRIEFEIDIVWDTVRDLQRWVSTRKRTEIRPSYKQLERAYRNAAEESRARPRLRTTRRLLLASYERRPLDCRPTRG